MQRIPLLKCKFFNEGNCSEEKTITFYAWISPDGNVDLDLKSYLVDFETSSQLYNEIECANSIEIELSQDIEFNLKKGAQAFVHFITAHCFPPTLIIKSNKKKFVFFQFNFALNKISITDGNESQTLDEIFDDEEILTVMSQAVFNQTDYPLYLFKCPHKEYFFFCFAMSLSNTENWNKFDFSDYVYDCK
jgi:hypothetical protein